MKSDLRLFPTFTLVKHKTPSYIAVSMYLVVRWKCLSRGAHALTLLSMARQACGHYGIRNIRTAADHGWVVVHAVLM
jgi:hypothetical protein